MLDLGALRVFYHTVKLGGVNAAARALKVSQPAVSLRLRALERQVGRKLHGKAGRRLVLTEDGRRLYESSRVAFEALESAEASLLQAETPMPGTIRIASLSEVAKSRLLPHIQAFRKRHPAVEFELEYRLPHEMPALLAANHVDLAVSNERYSRPQFELAPLLLEKVVCVGPAPAQNLSWRRIETLPWLAYGNEDPLWSEFEHAAAKARASLPRPALRIADVESVLRLAAEGAGFALAPAHALPLRRLPGLAVHRLPFAFSRPVFLYRLKTVPPSRAAGAFWDRLTRINGRARGSSSAADTGS